MVDAKDENGETYFTWEPSEIDMDILLGGRMYRKSWKRSLLKPPTEDRELTPLEDEGWEDWGLQDECD